MMNLHGNEFFSLVYRHWWKGLIGIIVICCLIVIVVKVLRKKKKQSKQPMQTLEVANISHIGKREQQQDCFGISDIYDSALYNQKGCLAVLCDGIGGLSYGHQMSAIATHSFLYDFEHGDNEEPSYGLLKMFQNANQKIRDFNQEHDDMGGTTLVAAWIKHNALYFLSVGDSRLYLIRNHSIIKLNREDTYAQELDRRAALGMIDFSQAQNDPQRQALNSFLGGQDFHIDRISEPIKLYKDDYILLASDGVFKALKDEEILKIIDEHALQDAVLSLQDHILNKNLAHQDNFSAVVIHIQDI